MSDFVKVARMDELAEGSPHRVTVDGRAICLVKLEGRVFAIDDTCTHAEASLSEGEVAGDEIMCPLHFAMFNIRTGEVAGPPADRDLVSYEARVRDGDIELRI